MGQRIDVKHLNIYYGDFLAVEDVNINIDPTRSPRSSGRPAAASPRWLRTLDRMHEIIPGAHVKGEVELEGKNLYAKDVDPVAVRRDVGMVFQRPNPFPTMTIRENVLAGVRLKQPPHLQVRRRRPGRVGAQGRQPVGRGQGPSRQPGHRPVRRSAAASVHRPRRGRAPAGAADGRAVLRARPDLDVGRRGPDQRAQGRLHDRDRDPQHAAGRPYRRLHRLLQPEAVGEPGHLEYFADTTTMFNNPQNAEAERYISGRFG